MNEKVAQKPSRRVPGSKRDRVGKERARACAQCGAEMRLPPRVASRRLRCSTACDLNAGLIKTGPAHPKIGTPCWPWARSVNNRGYGCISVDRIRRLAHRVAWELANGPVPDGMHVLHSCDNPRCCNPAHLRVGTRKENMQEAISKGRFCAGDRHPARTRGDYLPRGDKHWNWGNRDKRGAA